MQKKFKSLGLMSGTSGDGIDASIISSNGINHFEALNNRYFEYDSDIHNQIHGLKEKIHNFGDLKKYSKELNDLERKITLFHARIINKLDIKSIDIVGFHGHTIYHNPSEKISYQLGDAKLLSQLVKKKIIYNFRKNDILNGGEGAPLTPIFHQLLALNININLPICIMNIGGISNVTIVNSKDDYSKILSRDIGPGNCLIDNWIRSNTNKKFDEDGKLALLGKVDEIIFENAQELYSNRLNKNKLSFDINDFDISFARGLSLEDGAATLTAFTGSIIGNSLNEYFKKSKVNIHEILICGGGRKNKYLVENIKKNLGLKIKLNFIDEYNIEGDFVESQAFAFLAIRSFLKLPISFPKTTGCKKPCTGGNLIDF